MSFEIRADGIDAERLRAEVENRPRGAAAGRSLHDEEIRFIRERALEGSPLGAGRAVRPP